MDTSSHDDSDTLRSSDSPERMDTQFQEKNVKNLEKMIKDKKPSRRKKVIDPKTKLEILKMHRNGMSVSSLAQQFNVGEQTIRDWKKQEKEIRRMAESNKISSSFRKTSSRSNYPETDAALGIWTSQQLAQNKELSRSILADKARDFKSKLDLSVEIRLKDFKTSSRFIEKFCRRRGLKLYKRIRNKNVILKNNRLETTSFINELDRLIKEENYCPDQFFFLCETGFWWNSSPKQSLNDAQTNERITLGLCSNSTGKHKLPLLIVLKSKHLDCDSSMKDKSNKYVSLMSQQNAWFEEQLFVEWYFEEFVPSVENYLDCVGLEKKAILFMVQSPAHSTDLLANKIRCKFIPVAKNPYVQTLDFSSTLSYLKKSYRLDLLQSYLKTIQNSKDLSLADFIKQTDINYVLESLSKIWSTFDLSMIRRPWRRLLHFKDDFQFIHFETFNKSEIKCFVAVGLYENEFSEWIKIDNCLLSYEVLTDDQIVEKVTKTFMQLNDAPAEINNSDNNSRASGMSQARPKNQSISQLLSNIQQKNHPTDTANLNVNELKSLQNPTAKEVVSLCTAIERWIDSTPNADSELYVSLEYIRSAASKANLLSLKAKTNK